VEESVKYLKALTFLQLQAMTGGDTVRETGSAVATRGFYSGRDRRAIGEEEESAVSMALIRSKTSKSRRAR